MNSIPATAQLAAFEPPRMFIALVQGTVPAGFPSPADDFLVKRLDLNDLIAHPAATFMWRASGFSMIEAGIDDGDLLVVDRALTPLHMNIVVAQVDGEFTVKYLFKRGGRVKLMPANPTFPEITFRDGQQLMITGVVMFAIKHFVR